MAAVRCRRTQGVRRAVIAAMRNRSRNRNTDQAAHSIQ